MISLKELNKIECKIERLTEFFDQNGEWWSNYIYGNEDFINGYSYVLSESEIYKGELNDDLKEVVEYLENNNMADFIYNFVEIDIFNGIGTCNNEIASSNLGEQELQFSGLHDSEPNSKIQCVYSELIKGMSEQDIKKAKSNCSIGFISSDCLYLDCSYDRVSMVIKEDELLEAFSSEFKKAV